MTLKEALGKNTILSTISPSTQNTASNSREVLWLLEKATGQTSTELLLANEDTELSPKISEGFLHMLGERRKAVPLQYILGEWDFMGITIKCRPGVLIPRRDTEILAEETIKFLRNLHPKISDRPKILDMCTGSGCVGIALAAFCPDVYVTGADISDEAIKLARENAAINNLENRVSFIQSDLFENVTGRCFNCITANPPYIPTAELSSLPEEVQKEPVLALDGGPDGLDFYRAILLACEKFLLPGGRLFMEIGDNMGKVVSEMFRSFGFRAVVIVKDLESRDRVVQGTRSAVRENIINNV